MVGGIFCDIQKALTVLITTFY